MPSFTIKSLQTKQNFVQEEFLTKLLPCYISKDKRHVIKHKMRFMLLSICFRGYKGVPHNGLHFDMKYDRNVQ